MTRKELTELSKDTGIGKEHLEFMWTFCKNTGQSKIRAIGELRNSNIAAARKLKQEFIRHRVRVIDGITSDMGDTTAGKIREYFSFGNDIEESKTTELMELYNADPMERVIRARSILADKK